MEIKVNALLLRAADYGENDKIVTLFTAERGKLSAGMKGVKKAGAKLKFAAQPFCFAEYVLAERGGRYTVISASLHDGFYPIREDLACFYAAVCVCETCDKLLYDGMVNGELFSCAVATLASLSGSGGAFALVKFLLAALRLAGYPVFAAKCPVCGAVPHGRLSFDMDGGCFACRQCVDGVPASESTYRAICDAQADKETSEEDGVKRALRLLKAYFVHQTESELPSLAQFIELFP